MNTLFFRLLDAEDKGIALQEAIAALPQNPTPEAFAVNPESFEQVPSAPFAYWVSEKVRQLFANSIALNEEGRTVKQGLATADDFRFVRLFWEILPENICPSDSHPNPVLGSYCVLDFCWFPFAKGGKFSTFHSEIYLVINFRRVIAS